MAILNWKQSEEGWWPNLAAESATFFKQVIFIAMLRNSWIEKILLDGYLELEAVWGGKGAKGLQGHARQVEPKIHTKQVFDKWSEIRIHVMLMRIRIRIG